MEREQDPTGAAPGSTPTPQTAPPTDPANAAASLAHLRVKDGFRLRGESVTRLETFVDAAFAFAVTLMVISTSGVPGSMPELFLAVHRIPTMAACFAVMVLFWAGHDRWSRRFGLDTPWATVLSLALVLGVLVFVYPQRIIMSGALSAMTRGWVPADVQVHTLDELQNGFLIYTLGFAYLSAVLVLLDQEAIRNADTLQLDALERLEARRDRGSHLIFLGIALLAAALSLLARLGPNWTNSVPGLAYLLLGPAMHLHHARFHRLRAKLPQRALG